MVASLSMPYANIRAGEELSYDYQLQVDEPITRAGPKLRMHAIVAAQIAAAACLIQIVNADFPDF